MIKKILLAALFIYISHISGADCSRPITIAVFCSADSNIALDLKAAAYEFGQHLGAHHFGLIIGGGKSGLMKEIADGYVLQAITLQEFRNVILQKYVSDCHPRVASENMVIVESLYQRIDYFYEKADLCIVLPGGFGTLHELINCLVHEKSTKKPVILLNINGYWNHLIQQFKSIVSGNPAASKHVESFIVVETFSDLIRDLTNYLLTNQIS